MQEHSAGVILFSGKPPKFLLLHYQAGHWDFPKGGVEHGEDDKQAALRELKEETGIAGARIVPGFKGEISYFYRKGCKTVHKTVVYFLAESASAAVKLSSEHTGFKWLSFKDTLKQLTHENAREKLKKAREFL